jgi:hypothetical protein
VAVSNTDRRRYNNDGYERRALMLYYIWIDAEHWITVDDGNRETAGEAVTCHDGRVIPHPKQDNAEDDHNEHFDTEDARQEDGKTSLTAIDILMEEIYEMLAMQRNANEPR